MFDFPITTPANTTKADPQRTELRLRAGVITLVHIAFPPGSQGLLHVTVERAGSLLWPENEGDGFASDNFTVIFTPLYDLQAEPVTLTAVTYNLDDTFAHLVNIRISVQESAIALPQRLDLGVLERLFTRLFRRNREA